MLAFAAFVVPNGSWANAMDATLAERSKALMLGIFHFNSLELVARQPCGARPS